MTESLKNIDTAINLAKCIGEPVESITFELEYHNANGGALYSVVCANGQLLYVIKGETGEMMQAGETLEEAVEAWEKV